MGLKKRLKKFVDDYLLFREANVLRLMGELEKISITEMIKKFLKISKEKLKGLYGVMICSIIGLLKYCTLRIWIERKELKILDIKY